MNSHLSLISVYQRKYFLTRAVARAAMARRRLLLSPLACLPVGRGKGGGEGKGEVCNERRSGHWCGPE
jgi:hypothetical protein